MNAFFIVDDKTVEPNQVIQKQVLTFTVAEKATEKKLNKEYGKIFRREKKSRALKFEIV